MKEKASIMLLKIPGASSVRAAFSRSGRIENRVRIPDGTAAVCAEGRPYVEKRSLGDWEGKPARGRSVLCPAREVRRPA